MPLKIWKRSYKKEWRKISKGFIIRDGYSILYSIFYFFFGQVSLMLEIPPLRWKSGMTGILFYLFYYLIWWWLFSYKKMVILINILVTNLIRVCLVSLIKLKKKKMTRSLLLLITDYTSWLCHIFFWTVNILILLIKDVDSVT
jgi:hypothetical protein